jgi:mRNA interferase MazF
MLRQPMASSVERYMVYWVNLDPVVGSEIAKARPAVVVSDEMMNRALSTVVVCPVTSRLHDRWPSRVRATVAGRDAEIAVDQIRTVDKSRLGDQVDAVGDVVAAEVRHVITEMYGVLSVRG